jgi:hypothetical protein
MFGRGKTVTAKEREIKERRNTGWEKGSRSGNIS